MQFTWGHLLGLYPKVLPYQSHHSWLGVPMHSKNNQVSVCLYRLLNVGRSTIHLTELLGVSFPVVPYDILFCYLFLCVCARARLRIVL